MSTTEKSDQKSTKKPRKPMTPEQGLGSALAFLSAAAFVYFNPSYLGNIIVSLSISIAFTFIGIIALGSEIDRLSNGQEWGTRDLFYGLACLFIWGLLYYNFPSAWFNTILLIILILGLYGVMTGFVYMIKTVITSPNRKIAITNFLLFIVQLTAFIAGLLQSLQILKYIK